MTTCWFCSESMIWGGDHSAEDCGYEGEGIVANLSCPNCGAYAEFILIDEETDEICLDSNDNIVEIDKWTQGEGDKS